MSPVRMRVNLHAPSSVVENLGIVQGRVETPIGLGHGA